MKLIPNAVSRRIALDALRASNNAPALLFGAGILGVLGSTVLACRATLELEETLSDIQTDLFVARDDSAVHLGTEKEKTVARVYMLGVADVARLYGPAVIVGTASIFCLTKSHNILQERNLGLAAAYAAVDGAMKKYRSNVVTEYGEDVDRRMRYATEEVIRVDKQGFEYCDIRINVDSDPSMYAKFFDPLNPHWAEEAEYNYAWLRHKQDWFNHLLTMRGYIFLNEIYEDLGFESTETGNVVGWLLGNGDSYVDFGIFRGDRTIDFVNGREAAILLDFNVDGSILNLIDQIDQSKKRGFTPWQR